MEIIDSHCHLDMEPFNEDRDAVIARAIEAGVTRMVTIATGPDSARRDLEIVEKHPEVFMALGMHPHDAKDATAEVLDDLERLAAHPKVVAWGEIGLDYHYDFSPRDVQWRVFAEQIRRARALDLPIVIHSREADEDTVAVLRENADGPVRGVVHCYGGSLATAEALVELGLHISFTGTITFKAQMEVHEVVRRIGMGRILVETDSPYLAPKPHRGKRNEPAFTVHVVDKLAELLELPREQVIEQATANTLALFSKMAV
ncbi:TatD family hydrolase [bacterium]|nr:TatD family hydrolase [bacterium]MCB9475655.1 TatD family hydrolase [Deltaproteobacteria bacterium]